MAQQLRCANCGESFTPTDDGWRFIQEMAGKNSPLVMVKCTKCFEPMMCEPAAALRGETVTPDDGGGGEEEPLRCPVPQCIGWVSEVEEDRGKTFWGCGECGTVWRKKAKLDKAISKIVKRFPYREKSYVLTDDGWEPAPEDDEHPDYEELVEEEPEK